jgi:ribose-phosphate pyrophosphokinase
MVQKAVADALLKISRAPRPFKIFGLNSSNCFAKQVTDHLGIELTPHEELNFPDGENFAKSSDGAVGNVRGHNVFVIQSLYSDDHESVSDKFVKLCWMIGSLKDASAHEVTAVIPHLAWARQDRKTASREPITTKYVARMLEAVGMDRALLIDVHNLAAEQNAFSRPIDNLEAKNLQAEWCAEQLQDVEKIAVLTPDSGGLHRARRFRGALVDYLKKLGKPAKNTIECVIYDKTRMKKQTNSGLTGFEGGRIIGDVEGAHVVAVDDMISTGGTMKNACLAVEPAGGQLTAVIATHGLFCGDANDKMDQLDTKIVVCDTVDPWRLSERNRKKVVKLSTAKMVADAIERIHYGTGSISELLS